MKTVKIKMENTIGYDGRLYGPGEEVEVPQGLADAITANGEAAHIVEEAPSEPPAGFMSQSEHDNVVFRLRGQIQLAEVALQTTTTAKETADSVLADVRRENETLKADKAALEADKATLNAQIVALNTQSLPNDANSEQTPSDNSVKSEISQAAVSAVNDTATTKPTPKPAKE